MLKGIPKILSPELLKILMEMGHGDTLIIGDGNFPAASLAQRLVRCDGQKVSEVLDAVLKFFPLDTQDNNPVCVMRTDNSNDTPAVWLDYIEIISRYENDGRKLECVGRHEFYEQSKKAYAVISTGDTALYANLMLKKGVITED